MSETDWKFTLGEDGQVRTLMPGVRATILASDAVMLSHVTIAPNTETEIHSHPEEQWGVLLSGTCTRIQGEEEIEVREGDCWRTPGDVPHGIRTGASPAIILDIFSPPRASYRKPGSGFGG